MNTDELLEKIRVIIKEETVSKDELKAERKASVERLIKKIEDTQEDTINVLSKLINTGYNMHEEQIRAIEDHLDIPHKN